MHVLYVNVSVYLNSQKTFYFNFQYILKLFLNIVGTICMEDSEVNQCKFANILLKLSIDGLN